MIAVREWTRAASDNMLAVRVGETGVQQDFLTHVLGEFGGLSRSARLSLAALGIATMAAELIPMQAIRAKT